ncbi:MAG TPA: hypothetical protein VF621_17860, partial [Pyrinomonadaceae bacterium]
MPTWMKVLLVGGLVLAVLMAGLAVAGYLVVRRYGPGVVATTRQSVAEGREYGRLTDNEGCVNEAVARQSRAEGLGDFYKNTLFLKPCLEASRPTPGFCDAVPGQLEFTKSIGWQQQQCGRYGLPPEKQCGQLFGQVQQFCETRGRRGEGAGAVDVEVDPPRPPPPPPPPPP